MSADASGYSRLMATDEIATIHAITKHREAGERIAVEHGGRLVDSPGDNLLFEFGEPSGALTAALVFHEHVRTFNDHLPDDDRMHFRIGIHMGDIVVEADRIYGSGINIAARLERLARPGGICISDLVREHLIAPPALEDIGPQHVKNIPYPVHAFFVDVPGQRFPEGDHPRSSWPAIAILPFENLSHDPDQDYLAEGISDEVITALAMSRQFPVIARNSSFTYKGRTVDPKVIGTELNAAYVVVGTVRRIESRVRINAMLIDAETGTNLWADRWNTDIADVFETDIEIAQAIAVAIRPGLLKAESERAMRRPPADLTAWDYALRGLWHLNRTDRESNEQAITLFTRAVDLDPTSGFASGHLAHAHYRMLQHQWSTDPARHVASLIANAERAVASDPHDATGHLYRGLSHSVRGELPETIAALERSVELNPSLPSARSLLGQFLGLAGRMDEALAQLDKTIALSPRDPQLWTFHAGKAGILFIAGRYEEARQSSERAVAIYPDAGPALSNIAATSALLGDMPRAEWAVRELRRVAPNATLANVRAYLAAAPPGSIEKLVAALKLAGYELTDTQEAKEES